jgi:hypothetical protein
LTGSARPVAPSSEELVDHDAGSSPLARERSRERTSAGSRIVGGKTAVPVAGSEADKATGKCESVPAEHTVDGRRLGSFRCGLVDASSRKAVLVLSSGFGHEPDRAGVRQGASEARGQPRSRPRTPRRRSSARRRCSIRSIQKGSAIVTTWPKLKSGRQAWLSRGRIAARWSGAVASSTELSCHGTGEGVGARVSAAQAARSEIERSTSARVVRRLQMLARSILCARIEGSREANRERAS